MISTQQKRQSMYEEAVGFIEQENYASAISTLNQLGDYKDSAELLEEARELKTEQDYIAAISAYYHTVGLKADGTVVVTGSNGDGECDVSGWKDIIAIAAGPERTVGLKADGTVLAVGGNEFGSAEVSDWSNMATIAMDMGCTLGVRKDGVA